MPEVILRRAAIVCAIILLFGMAGDQTMWVRNRGQTITDGAIYNLVAILSGVVALIGLVVALSTWHRRLLPLLGLLVTIGAFGLTIMVAGVSVRARPQGEVWFYGAATHFGDLGSVAGDTFGSATTVYPAQAPFLFTAVAVIGALAAFGLVGVRLALRRSGR